MILFIFLLLTLFGLPSLKAHLKRKEVERDLLISKWRLARDKRLKWKESYSFSFDFNHHEYQELWQIEIGTEDIYLLRIHGSSPGTSWSDYCLEREVSRKDDS